jgi:hypothetical protein
MPAMMVKSVLLKRVVQASLLIYRSVGGLADVTA